MNYHFLRVFNLNIYIYVYIIFVFFVILQRFFENIIRNLVFKHLIIYI